MNPLSESLSVLLIVSLTGVFFFTMPAQAEGTDPTVDPGGMVEKAWDKLSQPAREVIGWLRDNLVDFIVQGVMTIVEKVLEVIGSVFQWFMDAWITVLETIRDMVIGMFDPYIEESNDIWTQTADLVISTFMVLSLVFIVRILKWILDLWGWLLTLIPVA